jgi:hypothetical protein
VISISERRNNTGKGLTRNSRTVLAIATLSFKHFQLTDDDHQPLKVDLVGLTLQRAACFKDLVAQLSTFAPQLLEVITMASGYAKKNGHE